MKHVIIDADTTSDDSIAIILGLVSKEMAIVGITTVLGDVEIEKCTRNALKTLEIAGRLDIPVVQGAARPLLRQATFGHSIHGSNGLGDIELSPPKTTPVPVRAVDFIIDTVLKHSQRVTLVSLGPLTNLALALSVEPAIKDNIEEIIWMGGAATVSDITDFNLFFDPEAAKIVFHAGVPFTSVGLDVTWQVVMQQQHVDAIKAVGSPVTDFLVTVILPYWEAYKRHGWGQFGRKLTHGFNMHDADAVAYAIAPELFVTKKMYASILMGDTNYPTGLMWADKYGDLGLEPNINACLEVDGPAVVDLYVRRITEAFGSGR